MILKTDVFLTPFPFFVSFVRFVVKSYFLVDSATYGRAPENYADRG